MYFHNEVSSSLKRRFKCRGESFSIRPIISTLKSSRFKLALYPEEVDGVAATRVYGKPDPSYGEIVAAELIVKDAFEASDVVRRVRHNLETSLAK